MANLFGTNIGFAAPWALLPLLALPILFFLLRATPPPPKAQDLPSARLLLGLENTQRTPHYAPWWLVFLRMLMGLLVCLGLAQPFWHKPEQDARPGALLLLIDDGWASAPNWALMQDRALQAGKAAIDAGHRVELIFTAPRLGQPTKLDSLPIDRLRALINGRQPAAWAPERAATLQRIIDHVGPLSRILWLSDGLSYHDDDFVRALSNIAPVEIEIADNQPAVFISDVNVSPDALRVMLERADDTKPRNVVIRAETSDNAILSETELVLPGNIRRQEVELKAVPPGTVPGLVRVAGMGAGGVRLLEGVGARRLVGLGANAQDESPLLSDFYYVERALSPFSEVIRGNIRDLAKARVSAIILADEGQLPQEDHDDLAKFVDAGGVLIRFSGPRLASQADDLTPTKLRNGGRNLGGTLAWEKPQNLAPFDDASPFYGIDVPIDAAIRQQVLAEPSIDLTEKTWARLQDGAPIVTGARRGKGWIVLFHVTASPEWSNLPLTGAFVDMLRRVVALGAARAEAGRGDDKVSLRFSQIRNLDASGRLERAIEPEIRLDANELSNAVPGPASPPGLYARRGETLPLNVISSQNIPQKLRVPPEIQQRQLLRTGRTELGGTLLGAALFLLIGDIVLALILSGAWPYSRGQAGIRSRPANAKPKMLVGFLIGIVSLSLAAEAPILKARAWAQAESALQLRLAYVRTGDSNLDKTARAGLIGLGQALSARTSIEPGMPDGVDLAATDLSVYPLLYWALPDNIPQVDPKIVAKLNNFMRNGGTLFLDTRDGDAQYLSAAVRGQKLANFLQGLDAPPLEPLPASHVLNKSFFLLKGTPGRMPSTLWVEAGGTAGKAVHSHDGVSPLLLGGGDWAGAWARDEFGRPLFPVEGGEKSREQAIRLGINVVMYVLTGNYKDDQVHLPALIERLGR